MAETIRDVAIRVGLKQVDAKLRVPEVQPVTAAFQKVEQSVNVVQEKLKQTNQAVETLGTQSVDNALKMNEGFRTAGEGAFTLARGIAFIGASTEEDMKEAIQQIAAIQGAFDAFKGSLDIVKGLTEGLRAMRAASTAAAAAETGLAAANTAVATTGTAATVSMSGLVAAVAPLALALTAAGVAYAFFSRSTRDAEDDISDFIDTTGRLEATFKGFALRRRAAFLQGNVGEELERQKEQLGIEIERLRVQERGLLFTAGNKELAERQAVLIGDQIKGHREMLTILDQQRRIREQTLQTATEELDKAKRLAETEQNRTRSIEQNLALQTPIEQARTKAILQRFQDEGAGALNRQELDVLRNVGGRGVAIRELTNRADQGLLGLGRGLAEQESRLQQEADERAQAEVEADPRVGRQRTLVQAAESAVRATDTATGQVLGLLEELVGRQRAVEDTVNRLEEGLQRGAVN